ncbi:hypothetical protein KM043_013728 [Ampulex compressa]|nr:hypothetical protein KM043_013728 [Ampulex compressa]
MSSKACRGRLDRAQGGQEPVDPCDNVVLRQPNEKRELGVRPTGRIMSDRRGLAATEPGTMRDLTLDRTNGRFDEIFGNLWKVDMFQVLEPVVIMSVRSELNKQGVQDGTND